MLLPDNNMEKCMQMSVWWLHVHSLYLIASLHAIWSASQKKNSPYWADISTYKCLAKLARILWSQTTKGGNLGDSVNVAVP